MQEMDVLQSFNSSTYGVLLFYKYHFMEEHFEDKPSINCLTDSELVPICSILMSFATEGSGMAYSLITTEPIV